MIELKKGEKICPFMQTKCNKDCTLFDSYNDGGVCAILELAQK